MDTRTFLDDSGSFFVSPFADGECSVCDIADKNVVFLTIPKVLSIHGEDYKVTDIMVNSMGVYRQLRSVVIEADLWTLRRFIFGLCTVLETVTIRSCLQSVTNPVFFKCPNLKTITIPERGIITPDAIVECPNAQIIVKANNI